MVHLSSLVQLNEHLLDEIQCEELSELRTDPHFALGYLGGQPVGQDEHLEGHVALIRRELGFFAEEYFIAVDHGL